MYIEFLFTFYFPRPFRVNSSSKKFFPDLTQKDDMFPWLEWEGRLNSPTMSKIAQWKMHNGKKTNKLDDNIPMLK